MSRSAAKTAQTLLAPLGEIRHLMILKESTQVLLDLFCDCQKHFRPLVLKGERPNVVFSRVRIGLR